MRIQQLAAVWQELRQHHHIMLALIAVAVGIVVAYAAILFRLALGAVQWLGFGFADEQVMTKASTLPWWQIMLVPIVGGLLVGLFQHRFMPGQRPQGVADVIEANLHQSGRLPLKTGLLSAGVSAASLGAGASTGREGPMVHLGASLAAWLAEKLGLHGSLSRTILGCGVAAAVAASFNAPIAGVFFALEVVIGHYALSAFAPVVIAGVAGTVISRIHLGELPAFILAGYSINNPLEFPAFMLLGGVCALNAMIFMWAITYVDETVRAWRVPTWLRPALAGLAVGAIATQVPHVLGVGYEATDAALRELLPLWVLLTLIIAKTATTAICVGCRFGGGVFSPSLFLGAMTGGAFGIIAASVFPELAASEGAYAIVGMSALAAAVLGAPISTILIVFEMTGDYKMTIAVMVATSTASIIVQTFMTRSFFTMQLQARGVDLRGGRARQAIRDQTVGEWMQKQFQTIPQHLRLGEIKALLAAGHDDLFYVLDDEAKLAGAVRFEDMRAVMFQEDLDNLIIAKDIQSPAGYPVRADTPLDAALQQMEETGADRVAVVNKANPPQLIGVLFHRDASMAYTEALARTQAEEHDDKAN